MRRKRAPSSRPDAVRKLTDAIDLRHLAVLVAVLLVSTSTTAVLIGGRDEQPLPADRLERVRYQTAEAADALSATGDCLPDDLDCSIRAAQVATRQQLDIVAADDAALPDTPGDGADVVEKLKSQARRRGLALDAADRAELEQVRSLPASIRDVVAAYAAYDDAATGLEPSVSPDKLLDLKREVGVQSPTAPRAQQAQLLHERGFAASSFQELRADLDVDYGPVLAARNDLLDAAAELPSCADGPIPGAEPIGVPGLIAIDPACEDNRYESDYALQIDLGGDDTYVNNAGGSNLLNPAGRDGNRMADCWEPIADPPVLGAAALVDRGQGNDQYGDPADPQNCGVNGAGFLGAGFLVDDGGDDLYVGGSSAVNGGTIMPWAVGFLLDAGGSDRYRADGVGVNGGSNGGLPMLVDVRGDDDYVAHGSEMIDLQGNPLPGESVGANGAGYDWLGLSYGFLADFAGSDRYEATSNGTNGGAGGAAKSFLYDARGNDRYLATDGGTNGGAFFNSVGFLADAQGDDIYEAGIRGTNGGTWNWDSPIALGTLIDAAGTDRYTGEGALTNGQGDAHFAFLLDGGGDGDEYTDGDGTCQDCGTEPSPTGWRVDGPVPCSVLAERNEAVCEEVTGGL